MASIPREVLEAWEHRIEPYVFATVDEEACPNAVYVTWARPLDTNRWLIVNNRFFKTMHNIAIGSRGALLFFTTAKESYQIKGRIAYYTAGPIYDEMKSWIDPKFPGLGAVVLSVDEAYRGAENLMQG